MGSGVFDFRSKEERERDYKAFYKRVFPGGEVQKERVRSVLAERLPGEEITFLLMYYITLKDAIVLDDELDFTKRPPRPSENERDQGNAADAGDYPGSHGAGRSGGLRGRLESGCGRFTAT